MSIITMATTKGGAGKTTVAQMIIGAVHQLGYSIGVIDCDANCSLSNWLNEISDMAIDVQKVHDESKIVSEARKMNRKHDLVIIDTAGAQSQATLFAIGCADLVLIPVQLSNSDVIEAIKTHNLVQSAGELAGREIPHRVVYTDYTPKTNIAKQVRKKIRKNGLDAMDTRLHHLVAYKELTFTGKIPKKGTAAAQGQLLVQEVFQMGHLPFMYEYAQAS